MYFNFQSVLIGLVIHFSKIGNVIKDCINRFIPFYNFDGSPLNNESETKACQFSNMSCAAVSHNLLEGIPTTNYIYVITLTKNAAKRTRQHARKKYRKAEYEYERQGLAPRAFFG